MPYQETPTPTSGTGASPEPPSGGGEDDRKKRNAASKKCRRLCEPTELGVLRVDAAIHQMWMQKGAARDKLIDAMVQADGDKDWEYKEYSTDYHDCNFLISIRIDLNKDAPPKWCVALIRTHGWERLKHSGNLAKFVMYTQKAVTTQKVTWKSQFLKEGWDTHRNLALPEFYMLSVLGQGFPITVGYVTFHPRALQSRHVFCPNIHLRKMVEKVMEWCGSNPGHAQTFDKK